MSRPTDEARYAQANEWMAEVFGTTMPAYLTAQNEAPITRAVKDTVAVLNKSGARELLDEWRREDALSNAGIKPFITVAGAMALILLHMRLGRVPHVVAITQTMHALNASNRDALGVDHKVDQLNSYDRVWGAIQRLILLVDEFYIPKEAPRGRHRILTAAEYATIVGLRDAERCQRNRARMHELANTLLEGTLRLLPAEVLDRWEGNIAGDATVVAMLGKAGNPNSKDTTKKRRSINADAGYYRRGGDHAGYTMEDAKHLKANGDKVKASSQNKLLWGIEAEIARMTRNSDGQTGDFPLLTAAIGFHIPGSITGAGATMVSSIKGRGHPVNYCIFDRAYPGGYVRDFHFPIRMLGGKLVFDYDETEFGVRAHDPRGFIQIVGDWYLDTLPDIHHDIDKPMVDLRARAKKPLAEIKDAERRLQRAGHGLDKREPGANPESVVKALTEFQEANDYLKSVQKLHRPLITALNRAEVLYAKQLAQREQYRLRPKGRMNADGSRRYIVPDTSKVLLAKTHRFTGKTVTIEADITAAGNPGGLKHEQHLTYGTPQWRQIYGLRNTVESVNRDYKRAQNEDLQNADRRHVRGNTFTYVIATIAAICENLRKILKFLKERLALRPINVKIADVPTVFWEPDAHTDVIDRPARC